MQSNSDSDSRRSPVASGLQGLEPRSLIRLVESCDAEIDELGSDGGSEQAIAEWVEWRAKVVSSLTGLPLQPAHSPAV
jgi:hypothetical protein